MTLERYYYNDISSDACACVKFNVSVRVLFATPVRACM